MIPAFLSRRLPRLALSAALACLAALPAAAAVSDWSRGQKAEARLIAAGLGADGRLRAGIEIVLPEGWHTYWRTPGDAGVVPEIDFSASANLGPAAIAFPAPTRLDEGDVVTNVYERSVILPVSAAVLDPAKPVDLAAHLFIGVCAKICVPDEIDVRLSVPAGETDGAAAAALDNAAGTVPGPAAPGVFALDGVVRDGGTDGRPVFRVTGTVPDAANATLFAEGPADWGAYTPDYAGETGGRSAWTVKFDRLGAKTPIPGAAIRFTVVSNRRAIDQTLKLE